MLTIGADIGGYATGVIERSPRCRFPLTRFFAACSRLYRTKTLRFDFFADLAPFAREIARLAARGACL
jgi:hypothetical protein